MIWERFQDFHGLLVEPFKNPSSMPKKITREYVAQEELKSHLWKRKLDYKLREINRLIEQLKKQEDEKQQLEFDKVTIR